MSKPEPLKPKDTKNKNESNKIGNWKDRVLSVINSKQRSRSNSLDYVLPPGSPSNLRLKVSKEAVKRMYPRVHDDLVDSPQSPSSKLAREIAELNRLEEIRAQKSDTLPAIEIPQVFNEIVTTLPCSCEDPLLYFAQTCHIVDRSGYKWPRLLLVSRPCLYVIKVTNGKGEIERCQRIDKLKMVSYKSGKLALFTAPGQYDLYFIFKIDPQSVPDLSRILGTLYKEITGEILVAENNNCGKIALDLAPHDKVVGEIVPMAQRKRDS